jgi:hypothetical protein
MRKISCRFSYFKLSWMLIRTFEPVRKWHLQKKLNFFNNFFEIYFSRFSKYPISDKSRKVKYSRVRRIGKSFFVDCVGFCVSCVDFCVRGVGFCGGLRRFLRGFHLYAFTYTPHPAVLILTKLN